jgi:hypothetical protein
MVRSSGGSGTPAIGGAIAGLNREARDLEWRRAVVDVDDEDAGGLAAFDADLQRACGPWRCTPLMPIVPESSTSCRSP